MATSTLERQTEVVVDKERAEASVTAAAKSESRPTVSGEARPGTARAWNAQAQID